MRALALAGALVATVAIVACGSSPRVHPPGWGSTPKGLRGALPRPVSGPSVEMFDTVTLSTVPSRPFALAGYTSGFWPTYLPLRHTYPSAHTVSIAVSSSHHADCLDDEPGDATPAQAGPWAVADIRAGFAKPCVYSDLSQMPSVQASLRSWLGSNWRSRVFLWLAWYRYRPGLVSGYDAVQWSDRALGRNLDESTVTLPFLSIAQPPYVPPAPPKPTPPPKPKPSARQVYLEHRILLLRRLLGEHKCRVIHGRQAYPSCPTWARHGREAHRELHALVG